MPRVSRANQVENSLTFHVYNRGNGKLDVFHDQYDFKYFLDTVKRYKDKYSFYVYHWVLMNNHFHLLLSVDVPKCISKCLGAIQQVYAQHHHKRWKSAGRLWQGRFVSQVVQKEKYLFECGRYIERNPMRAGLVMHPWDYRWSSCQSYVKNKDDAVLTQDAMFDSFGDNDQARIINYQEWLMEGESSMFYDMRYPVGDSDFLKCLSRNKGRSVVDKRGRPPKAGLSPVPGERMMV